jgi:hypothetical protein
MTGAWSTASTPLNPSTGQIPVDVFRSMRDVFDEPAMLLLA